jgi:YggT family protein
LGFICTLLFFYQWIIFARILMSWIRIEPGTAMASVYSVVFNLTEPVLGPMRRAIPPMRMGMAALDLSPIIVFIGIMIIC